MHPPFAEEEIFFRDDYLVSGVIGWPDRSNEILPLVASSDFHEPIHAKLWDVFNRQYRNGGVDPLLAFREVGEEGYYWPPRRRPARVRSEMRFRLRSLFLFAALIALLVCIALPLRPVDGFIGGLFSLLGEDTTVWADAYSDSGFRAVHVGMSRSEVRKLLGTPLYGVLYADGTEGDCWTQSHFDSSYRQREVIFEDDRVVKIVAGLWID